MKLKINRKTWDVANPEGGTLYNEETGKSCCLGFHARALGYKNMDIKESSTPSEFCEDGHYCNNNKRYEKFSSLLYRMRNNKICKQLMSTNDSECSLYKNHPEKREKRIKELFKKINVDVEFVGKYPQNVE